jgi:flagellar P-ring protein precursor FlgI
MKKIRNLFILFYFVAFAINSSASADRLKDLTSIAGIRSNQLIGYGLVVGLAGTGDGNTQLIQQSMKSMVSQLGLSTDSGSLNGKNAASVMITAELPPFVKPGQNIDITVSTLGAAKSLRGGTLLMTPLKGADGETYAIAQVKGKRMKPVLLREIVERQIYHPQGNRGSGSFVLGVSRGVCQPGLLWSDNLRGELR